MRPGQMNDYLARKLSRRTVLRGAAILGTAASPVLWRQSRALAATPSLGPQWVSFGSDPASQMYLSWSSGSPAAVNTVPPAPQARWGPDASYGNVQAAAIAQVPVPAGIGEPTQNTFYLSTVLSGLAPGITYHYSVSNDGITWGPDAVFTTAPASGSFRFTAFGDEASNAATAAPMAALVSSLGPAFHLIAGDLSYPGPGLKIPDVTGYHPAFWDKYLAMAGPAAAQSVPWSASVGQHEVEPLSDDGYAGFVTRLPQDYDLTSGSPVVHAFTCGNAAFIHLDGNDLSVEIALNNGYTGGAQTAWLAGKLAGYRAAGSGIDFIVVVVNCCCYSSNVKHGSDGGLRDVWGPLFDTYQVDLVISGHVHAYERTNPMRAGKPTRQVAAGGTVNPPADGTTYICTGGGGNGLYKVWHGTTLGGDAGNAVAPKIWRWSGGDTAAGGSGTQEFLKDTAKGFSAFRRAAWHCLCVDVTAPAVLGGQTSMLVRAMMPTQTATAVTSIASPGVMDSVTLVRASQA
jgi:hypothetical protein